VLSPFDLEFADHAGERLNLVINASSRIDNSGSPLLTSRGIVRKCSSSGCALRLAPSPMNRKGCRRINAHAIAEG